ncbi:MAG: protein kinase [Gemmatimonadota bacterium]|nr:MAG: protein kinase [Gemmatimonadota bacterium]
MAATCLRCCASLPFQGASCPECGTPGPAPEFYLRPVDRSPISEELLEHLRAATSGEFEIIREIGRGGMARVYLAREIALDRQVALKVLSPLFSEYPEIVRRFQQEARTAGQLSHPHILPVFAVYQGNGLSFFTMPFVKGCSLREILREAGPLEVEEALEYLRQAASGLAYAHQHGVVHRDVKPENILFEESTGRLMLTDFGLAKALGAESLTVPGDVIGTPHYMAPEQCEGQQEVDARTDQYSLALVAYEMLTGEYPLVADGLRELLMKQLSEDPPPLSARRPDVPAHVSEAIHRALSKDPEDRFSSIEAFARALMGAAQSEGVGSDRRRRVGQASGAAHAKTLRMRKQLLRLHRKRRLRRWAGRGAVAAAASLMLYLGVAAVSGGVPLSRREASGDSAEGLSPGTGTQRASQVAFVEVDALVGDGAQLVGPPAGVLDSGAGDLNATGSQEGAGGEELAAATPPRPRTRRANTAQGGEPSGGEQDRTVRESGSRAQGSETPSSVGPGAGERAEAASSDAVPGATEPAPGDVSQPTDEVTSEELDAAEDTDVGAVAHASPGSSPEWVLEQYRLALEQEDLEALGRIYGGAVPAQDVRMLQRIFDSAEEIQVEMKADEYQVEGGRAILNVDFPMSYVLERTRRAQRFTLKLRMTLEQAGEGWRLVALEQR